MVWVCVAGVLAALYLLVGGGSGDEGRSGVPEAGGVLRLEIDPATVTTVRVERDGAVAIAERDGASPTGWIVRWTDGGRETAWPAREQAVRAGVRLLATAAFEARPGEGAGDTAGIEVEMADGRVVTLSLGEAGVGGRVAAVLGGAQESGEGVWASREVAGLANPEALLAWRDPRLLARLGGGGATGLRVEGGSSGVELRRARGRWRVEAPVQAIGDDARIEDVLARLASIEAEELDAGAADGVTRLDTPVAAIVIETERREARGDTFERVVVRQTLEVGGEADAGGRTRFARASLLVEREGETEATLGPVVGIMEVTPLGRVTARAAAYVARAPVGTPAGDVGVVSVRGTDGNEAARFERERLGWRRIDGGRDAVVGEGEAAGLATLLELCCGAGFERVEVLGRDSGAADPIAEVRLETLGGGVIASLEFAGAGSDAEGVVARDGGVFWIATGEEHASIARWLASLVGGG